MGLPAVADLSYCPINLGYTLLSPILRATQILSPPRPLILLRDLRRDISLLLELFRLLLQLGDLRVRRLRGVLCLLKGSQEQEGKHQTES